MLGGAALFDNSAPPVCNNSVPQGPCILYTAGAELSKRAAPPSTGDVEVYQNHQESPIDPCIAIL